MHIGPITAAKLLLSFLELIAVLMFFSRILLHGDLWTAVSFAGFALGIHAALYLLDKYGKE